MFKRIFISIFLFLSLYKPVSAEGNFKVNANIEYKVLESGTSAVTHTITIKNNTSHEYAKNYLLELSNMDPNKIKAYEEGNPIPLFLKKVDNKYLINVAFETPVVGKSNSRTFIVTYEEVGLAQKNGEIWEISIPALLSKYDDYKIVLSVPASFGEAAIITPQPTDKIEKEQRLIYTFGNDINKSSVINAVFGKFQVFSFKLLYHLANENNKRSVINIAIPPDTSTQKVYYSDIRPAPSNVYTDDDGNWFAQIEMDPKESRDVTVEGYAQIFANPVKLLTPNLSTILSNLGSTQYWEVDDPQIKDVASNLKTAEEIYGFVVDTLNYNYDRINPDVERFGAKKALLSANDAICTEFTDLFIALARSAGIPAREINGYAHSDNPDLQPLSLVSDILHSWPEYWDESRQNWVPVDPTWESTSEIDYFNKFDLKHIAFVIHGKSSTDPLPAGSYKSKNMSKDIFVEFSQLPSENIKTLEIDHKVINYLNVFKKRLEITLKNNTLTAFYNISPKISYSEGNVNSENIDVLPPFGTYKILIDLPVGFFALDSPNSVAVSVDNTIQEIIINKTYFVIQQLLLILSILIVILLFVLIRIKKIDPKNYMLALYRILINARKT